MTNKPDFSKRLTQEEKILVRRLARLSRQNTLRRRAGGMKKELRMRPMLYKYFKGKCFWCDIDTVYITQEGKALSNMATIDHIRSRFYRKKGEETLKVLCCYRCNQLRARNEIIQIKKNKTSPCETGEEVTARTLHSDALPLSYSSRGHISVSDTP